jgi:hypothetical protein
MYRRPLPSGRLRPGRLDRPAWTRATGARRLGPGLGIDMDGHEIDFLQEIGMTTTADGATRSMVRGTATAIPAELDNHAAMQGACSRDRGSTRSAPPIELTALSGADPARAARLTVRRPSR